MIAPYFFISVLALCIDMGVLHLAVRLLGIHFLVAAPVAFLCGVLVVYVLSARYAFDRKSVNWGWEFVVFVVTGILGLLVNEVVLWLMVGHSGQSLLHGKIVSAAFSFGLNFSLRKRFMLRKASPQGAPVVVATQF